MPEKRSRVRVAYEFLRARDGTQISMGDLAGATGWTAATARTYVAKKWAGLLLPLGEGTFKVVLPKGLSWETFAKSSTQVVFPPQTPTPSTFDYDVALSFAGEDRTYVEQVAAVLKALDVAVFYDAYEQHTLWGKDLYVHLDEVYRLRSRYCVMFLSRSYAGKLWTGHERQSAQARAFTGREEYILPVKLDDTEIPGIRPTTGYLDGRAIDSTQVARLIVKKLGKDAEFLELLRIVAAELPDYTVSQDGPDLVFNNAGEDYTATLSIRMLLEALRADQLWYFFRSSIFVQ